MRSNLFDPQRMVRRSGMSREVAQAWLDQVKPPLWALENGPILHQAGLTPAQGQELYNRLSPEVREDIGRLVDAGRMASLDTVNLHWWARSGFLKSTVTIKERKGKPPLKEIKYTPWVTQAFRYAAAAGNDQRLGALAAAAGLTLEEVSARRADGSLTEESLRVLTALADTDDLFDPPPVV